MPRGVRLLLWRNCVRRKRAKCASCVELLSPCFIVVMFTLIYTAFSNKDKVCAAAVPCPSLCLGRGLRAAAGCGGTLRFALHCVLHCKQVVARGL